MKTDATLCVAFCSLLEEVVLCLNKYSPSASPVLLKSKIKTISALAACKSSYNESWHHWWTRILINQVGVVETLNHNGYVYRKKINATNLVLNGLVRSVWFVIGLQFTYHYHNNVMFWFDWVGSKLFQVIKDTWKLNVCA